MAKRSYKSSSDISDPEVESPIEKAEKVTKAVQKLKRDHIHGGKAYEAGTPVSDLGASDSALSFMKDRGII